LTVESKKLFINEGLTLFVKDFDQFGQNEMLGMFKIPPAKLYTAKGERMEFKLEPPPGSKDKTVNGYMAIRCRRATEYDKKFMEGYEASGKGVIAADQPKTNNSDLRSILTRQYKVEKDGTKKVRVMFTSSLVLYLMTPVLQCLSTLVQNSAESRS
jgi:hypothetical protein